MNLKALVATIILGTSSVAMAAPEIRDHRPVAFRPQFESWSLLGSGQLVRGKDTLYIHAAGKIDKLKLEATRGMFFVDKLVLTYGNGRTETIEVNQWVGARGGSAALVEVAGRKARSLKSVTVIGRGNGFRAGASYKLLALG